MSLGSNGVDMVLWLRKITTRLRGTNFCVNWSSSVCFATSFMQLQNIPDVPKYYKTDRNISLGSNGVDWVCSLRKIPMWLRGTNFCINCSSSPRLRRVSCSYEAIPNAPQALSNALEHEFRVQWRESGVLISKNYNATSGHKLLH